MKELLEEFVRLAPADIHVGQPIEGRVWVNHKLFFDLSNDRSSAEAIIFLWDWLEAQQDSGGIFNPLFFRNPDMKYEVRFPGKTGTDGPNFAGKTRIEALVRACVAVWKAKGGKDGATD